MNEYIPWYEPGTSLCRCLTCGCLLSTGDVELHDKWHLSLSRQIGPTHAVDLPSTTG